MFAKDTDSNKRLKSIFQGMKRRCYNPNCKAYRYYGAKGVAICQEWLDDPETFFNWSRTNGYFDQDDNTPKGQMLSIDRIDPNGDYSPDNCQWITVSENSGKDKGVYVTINKITQNLTQWALYFNLNKQYFLWYYNRHTLQQTIKLIREFFFKERTTVDPMHGTYLEVNGKRLHLTAWAKEFSVSERYFISYYQRFGEQETIEQIKRFLSYQGNDIRELFKTNIHFLTVNGLTMTYSEWEKYLNKGNRWCRSIVTRHSEEYLVTKIKYLLDPTQLTEEENKILKPKYKRVLITVRSITLGLTEWGKYLHLSNVEYIKSYYRLHGFSATISRIEQLMDGNTVGKKLMITVDGVSRDYTEWAEITGLKKQTLITYVSRYGMDYAVKKIKDHTM